MTTPSSSSNNDGVSGLGRDYSEKRNFIRMRLDASVSFKTETGKEAYIGRCRNLSGTGMLMETDKKLMLGNKVTITLPSERSELPNLEALAEVVRIDHIQSAHTYYVGLAIRSMY